MFYPVFSLVQIFHVQDFMKDGGRKQSPWLYLGGVKAFADGSLGSSSALLYEVEICYSAN